MDLVSHAAPDGALAQRANRFAVRAMLQRGFMFESAPAVNASWILPVAAAVLAGGVNAIAGGGSLITFPALLSIGVAPLAANATNTTALVPGSASAFWTYRGELASDRRTLVALGIPSVLGGVLGAALVMRAGDALFARLVPWLILAATALFVAQGPISAWTKRRVTAEDSAPPSLARLVALGLVQLAVSTYGGFFGAGMGIMMLGVLALVGVRGIHRMNGLKNFAAVAINGVAAVTFAVKGQVEWGLASAMAVGAIAGGYAGGRVAQRVGPRVVRIAVVLIGVVITIVMFARQLGLF
jgi:uncharacterized membrane protein YfcA